MRFPGARANVFLPDKIEPFDEYREADEVDDVVDVLYGFRDIVLVERDEPPEVVLEFGFGAGGE